ncbi:MAG: hypothetical protein IPO92_06515 [Saprospiraceae bacterium]|nr:hypothetical protein [Saprospiraceae bacterium]
MDDIDGFFNQISVLDMEIQMKNNLNHNDRALSLKTFKQYLQTEVTNWETDEKDSIMNLFKNAKVICDKVSPRIFPDGLRIIKIKNGHYGNDVYYTRGRNIMIPENIFKDKNFEKQIPVMLHEIFHILSRYRPELRKKSYALIGFKDAGKPVKLRQNLENIILTNPDGVSMRYVIDLDETNQDARVVPLITSKFKLFNKSNGAFFDYLNFDLYSISDQGSYFEVENDALGKTTLNVTKTPSFFTKIKDNTQYIIHPDEIMADNFMLALLANYKNDYKNFSIEGKKLIDDLLVILSKE